MTNHLDDASSEQSVILHHIDKTYSTLTRVWDSTNRILYAQPVLSIIVIALSSGIVSVEEQVEVSGLKFKIALWLILAGGSLLIEFLLISFFSQDSHADRLESEIKRLYSNLGYTDKGVSDNLTSPFSNPASYNTIAAPALSDKNSQVPRVVRWFDSTVSTIVVLLLLMVLPIGAQIIAAIRLGSTFGAWIWAPFTILFIMDIWTFSAFLARK